MSAEIGHFSLILALLLAGIGATVPFIGAQKNNIYLINLADRIALGLLFFTLLASAMLSYAFITSDFSVKIVADNSHTAKPLLYKITGFWANHEGSLLLWVQILTLFGAAISLFGKALPPAFRAQVLSVQAFIAFGFLLFMLATSNPFDRLAMAPLEGNGLNPLLQDPGLAFHPPMLYLGYVGLSVAFSFAIAALINADVSPMWARWVRPWTLTAWCFLTGGIALGSWWAYYELGWGGWWFWDPVENASFMPWLVATALLHSAIVVEKRDTLKSWCILLAIVAFSFSLLGTFLVRSGVLTSVHAFAVDPERGVFILGFLGIVIGGSLALYAWRAPQLKAGGFFAAISREGGLILNNILLSTFAAVVLIGTLYPLVLEAYDGTQISVGPPFFNFATTVLMSPLIVALAFGPLLAWKRGNISKTMQRLLPAVIVVVFVLTVMFLKDLHHSLLTMMGLGLAAWLIAGIFIELNQRVNFTGDPSNAWAKVKRLPRASWGMRLAHLGVAFVLLGVTISEAWTDETLIIMSPGDTTSVGGYTITFDGVEPHMGANYSAIMGHFTASRDGKIVTKLDPEERLYANPVMSTTEAAIHSFLAGDLYAVIGEQITGNSWSMRLYFKPFISGLWLGAFMMMLGAVLSLSDRKYRKATLLKSKNGEVS